MSSERDTTVMTMPILQCLNNDVLSQIYEELRPGQHLQPLSLTCKWVRKSVQPILFRSCRQAATGMTWEEFVPRQLWPYICELYLYGRWWRIDPPPPVRNPAPFYLNHALYEMPRLSNIHVTSLAGGWVPWEAMVAMLSSPQLRSFDVDGLLYIDEPSKLPTFTAASLTHYRQVALDFRRDRYNVANSWFLWIILKQPQVQDSLECLEVPSEFAPIGMFPDYRWPRLRRICLRGENWTHEKPLVHYFRQLPALQELVLMLGHRNGTNLLRLCPPDWAGPLPWPELKTLIITHPDPYDQLYSSLPDGLRHLALRCWPRHYNSEFYGTRCVAESYGWGMPILSSSALSSIFRRCQMAQLAVLEIEYMGDEADIAVLRLLSHAFPNLSSLTMLRYRPRNTTTIPIREIGEALGTLHRLRYLFLYLDFAEAPHPLLGGLRPSPLIMEDRVRMLGIFERSADIISRSFGPSLEIIAFLLRGLSSNNWTPYCVYHMGDGRHVSLDPDALINRGLISSDDCTPPTL